MPKIYDFTAYNQDKGAPNVYNFETEIGYVDLEIFATPEEYDNISDAKAYIEYNATLILKKAGIDSILFNVSSIELEFEVDDYPEPPKEFDVDLIPGRTVDHSQIKTEENDGLIPSYPSKIEINMQKSTDPRSWQVVVYFGFRKRS